MQKITKEQFEKIKKAKELEKFFKECIERGEIKENASPLEWMRFAVSKDISLAPEIEKAARDFFPNFDEYVYGTKK